MAYQEHSIYLIGVQEQRSEEGPARLTFATNRGEFAALADLVPGAHRGVVMLGEGADFQSPGGVFETLASELRARGISALRLGYRVPGDCAQCGIDALIALQYLDDESVRDVVLVGWSFGAAVAVAVGSVAKTVGGVAAVSTITTNCANKWLKTKPLLLIHGDSDLQSPIEVPRAVYNEAGAHRKFLVYPHAGHDLAGSERRLHDDLTSWISTLLKLDLAA